MMSLLVQTVGSIDCLSFPLQAQSVPLNIVELVLSEGSLQVLQLIHAVLHLLLVLQTTGVYQLVPFLQLQRSAPFKLQLLLHVLQILEQVVTSHRQTIVLDFVETQLLVQLVQLCLDLCFALKIVLLIKRLFLQQHLVLDSPTLVHAIYELCAQGFNSLV